MKLSAFEKLTLGLAPRWTLSRVRARMAVETVGRHYEAAQPGRRTQGWARTYGDADHVARAALVELRLHARDLVRNNAWARRAQRVIANNTVGWGIVPKALGPDSQAATALFKAWAESTECDADGRHTFAGLQSLVMRTIVESGEVLVRRRVRRAEDGLTIPLQLQVLEPDFLDHMKDSPTSQAGGPIVQGVEFDKLGKRAAYWIFAQHPGSGRNGGASYRVPATEILHVFLAERPGQTRGVSWFGAAIVPLKDFDEYEDATLVAKKIAACFAGFVTDVNGDSTAIGEQSSTEPLIETFEPGMINYLPPGKDVKFGAPPTISDDNFSTRTLRRIAAALGVTFEDLTGDYSQVNFSSARMSRIAHWGNVRSWQSDMLIPQFCDGVWAWAMEAAVLASELRSEPAATWTCPPMPMIEPDKEGLAYQRLVRNGTMTHDEMIREQGGDPDAHWQEYAAGLKRLDALGIQLDSDVRAVSQAGLTQQRAGMGGDAAPAAAADRGLDLEVDIDDSDFAGLNP